MHACATSMPSSSSSSRTSAASGVSPGSTLPPRKLPEACHRLAGRALGDEDAPIRVDERDGGDEDGCLHHAGLQ